jgi:hypothetical protein
MGSINCVRSGRNKTARNQWEKKLFSVRYILYRQQIIARRIACRRLQSHRLNKTLKVQGDVRIKLCVLSPNTLLYQVSSSVLQRY